MSILKQLPFRKKYRAKLLLQKFRKENSFTYLEFDNSKQRAFIFLAADYGNLGDVAITYAQTKFLKDNLDGFQVVEIPISKSLEGLHFVKKHIQSGDIVTTVGGGNLGDMYDQIEYIRQLVVKFFPKNKIISFPQTFDFSDNLKGEKALKKAKNIYNHHQDLVFVAREQVSYKLMQEHFNKAKVLITPDIVLSMDKRGTSGKRDGVVVCLREDKEKNLTTSQTQFLNSELKSNFKNITYYDTHIGRDNLSSEERNSELKKIWNAFRSAELVVTDRLHGMIFCYITNTPCLVFLNNNHKVKGTYSWFSNQVDIKLVENFNEAEIKEFLNQKGFLTQEYQSLNKMYQNLKAELV